MTAIFPDGCQMDIKCCGCKDAPSWTEAVLFDKNGCELCCTEVGEEFGGIWELSYNGTLYVSVVVLEFDINTTIPGREIKKETYDHYLNIGVPIKLNAGNGWFGGFQIGEAFDTAFDTRNGAFRPVYGTFTCRDDRYFFQGFNFYGEVDSQEFIGRKARNK